MIGLQELDIAVRATEEWITDLQKRLGWLDKRKAYLALISTLHALRDCLPLDEAVYLGNHLPGLLRGLYYEGCHPTRHTASLKSRSAFLQRIHEGMHRDPGIDAEQVAEAVFAELTAKLPAAEIEDVKALMSKSIRPLWPS